jgi:hypothetical protein
MRHFIFITSEGHTYQPNTDATEPDIENCQVIGRVSGETTKEAFENLLKENTNLLETTFDEIICLELKSQVFREHFYLSEKRDKDEE